MTDQPPTRLPVLPAVVLVVVFLCAALPLILSGTSRGRGAYDQVNFHEPAIRTFIEQWPRPDVSDYLSATTPGYHIALAAIGVLAGDSTRTLQLAGCLMSAGFLLTLGLGCSGDGRRWMALVRCLPVLCSLYVFSAGVWLLPDNAGWWGVLGVVLIALRRRVDAWTYIGGGLVLTLLVCFRQIHIWAAAPLWVAAWLGSVSCSDDAESESGEGSDGSGRWSGSLFSDLPASIRRAGLMLIATLPAFAVLGWFVSEWGGLWGGGLVPPTFQNMYHGRSPAAPAFVLSLLAGFSVFFAGELVGPLARLWREHRAWVLTAAAAGLVVAIIPETCYDTAGGRFSGLWNVVRVVPTIGDRSPVVWVLSACGGVALLCWAWVLPFRDRWVIVSVLVGFTAAQAASPMLWQRYNEPMVLMLLALMSGREPRRSAGVLERWSRPWRLVGPVVLALCLAGLTAVTIARAGPPGSVDLDAIRQHGVGGGEGEKSDAPDPGLP